MLKLGADIFGTGKTGAAGGDRVTEPQGNEEAVRFDEINIKEVEEAPKEEMAAYDLNGPENAGISPDATEVPTKPEEIVKKSTSGEATQKNLVYISCGHTSGGNKKLEFPGKQYYFFFTKNLYRKIYPSIKTPDGAFARALYKVLSGKSAGSGNSYYAKFHNLMKKYGIEKKSGGSFVPTTTGKNYSNYYAGYGKAIDAMVEKVNAFIEDPDTSLSDAKRTVRSTFKAMQAQSNGELTIIGNSTKNCAKVFKIAAQAGASYSEGGTTVDEYEINYDTMQAIGAVLTAAGYTVKYSRSTVGSSKLTDGNPVTNKNMALAANNVKASLHLNIHWDSSNGKEKINLYVGKSLGSAKKESKNVANAMKKAGAKGVIESDGYTMLNWAEVPTLIVECGALNSKDFGKVGFAKTEKGRKKKLNTWAKNNKKVFVEGAKAATK